MSPGRHAASDASFVRSAGGAATRGIILIVFAVVVGVVLIATAVDDNGPGTAGAPTETSPQTTAPPDTVVTTETTAAVDSTPTSEDPTDTTATTTDPVTTDTTGTTSPGAVFEPRPPNVVMVQVVNTTRTGGAAGKVSDTLNTQGYNMLGAANDDGGLLTDTNVYHIGGYLLEAQAIATVLGLDPETSVLSMPDNVSTSIDDFLDPQVLVRVGTDLADS